MSDSARAFLMDRAAPGLPAGDATFLAGALLRRCTARTADIRLGLGLDGDEARAMTAAVFPALAATWPVGTCFGAHVRGLLGIGGACTAAAPDPGPVRPLLEEDADLRALLLSHRSSAGPVGAWMAAIIARAALEADHLWQCIGLAHRDELTVALDRHFHPLKAGNTRNMRWKKYFFSRLAPADGRFRVASACRICPHRGGCFAPGEL